MTKTDREFYIEWLAMTGNYSKSFYEKMKDEELEFYYKEMVEEQHG